MKCPKCGSPHYGRVKHGADPTDRDGVTFRAHVCSVCDRLFMSAQLVVTDEFEPVARLDAVLKALMDESDERATAEIAEAESLEELIEEESDDSD